MAEIPFETLLAARETTRGTAISAPTHLLHMGGKIKPTKAIYRPAESRGTLAANYRSAVTRRGAEWETTEEAIDTGILPFLLTTVLRGGTITPTTPGGGTNSRLWEFTRNITTDNLSSLTLWFGDPTIRQWVAAYAMADELTLSNSAADETGVLKAALKGQCAPIATNSPVDAAPADIAGALLPGQLMQLWIDTASAIGTTAVTGRLLSAKHTLRTGVTYKYLGGGPTASLGFALVGREQVVGVTTELVLELPDMAQYDQWVAHDTLRVRVRHNGPLIETTLYHYVEVDTYGPFEALDWGENQTSNRTIQLTIEGQVDATLGSDCRVAVQNARTTL